ncbi:MAG: signal peptidase II, partial [Deltaproteobacteria bacterium]|nr:signal peptidase II [Deltaproteobacteria bacterium]
MKIHLPTVLPLVLFFALMLTLDQLTTEWVLSTLRMGHSITVIPGFFDLSLVYNPGAAFGMFADLPEQTRKIALVSVGVIALIIVGRLLIVDARQDRVAQYALAGILSGAFGNIIDRLRFGAVID